MLGELHTLSVQSVQSTACPPSPEERDWSYVTRQPFLGKTGADLHFWRMCRRELGYQVVFCKRRTPYDFRCKEPPAHLGVDRKGFRQHFLAGRPPVLRQYHKGSGIRKNFARGIPFMYMRAPIVHLNTILYIYIRF